MAEHHATVTINAPVHQVYTLFSHFNDFPKFMSFVKEVTYYDDQRSHWVAQATGKHEWDAINENWIEDRQIGWRSTSGLENSGVVTFAPVPTNRTIVDVFIQYTPPAGFLGKIGEQLGLDISFESKLQQDLDNFAQMVNAAPEGTLDPMSSHYLFHKDSAAARGQLTQRQKESIAQDPMMSQEALSQRSTHLEKEKAQNRQAAQEEQAALEHNQAIQQETIQQQKSALQQQAVRDQLAQSEEEQRRLRAAQQATPVDPEVAHIQATLGGRNASHEEAPIGDLDSRMRRYPDSETDPMLARHPKEEQRRRASVHNEDIDTNLESPWRSSDALPDESPPDK